MPSNQLPTEMRRQLERQLATGDAREVTLITRTIADMSDVHAETVIQATKNQFAIPARQETYRHALTVGLIAVVVVWLLSLVGNAMASAPAAVTPLLWTIAAAVAVLGAEPVVKAIAKQFKKSATSE